MRAPSRDRRRGGALPFDRRVEREPQAQERPDLPDIGALAGVEGAADAADGLGLEQRREGARTGIEEIADELTERPLKPLLDGNAEAPFGAIEKFSREE